MLCSRFSFGRGNTTEKSLKLQSGSYSRTHQLQEAMRALRVNRSRELKHTAFWKRVVSKRLNELDYEEMMHQEEVKKVSSPP